MSETVSTLSALNAVGINEARALYFGMSQANTTFETVELNHRFSAALPEITAHPFQSDRFAKYVDRYYMPAGLMTYEWLGGQTYAFTKVDNILAETTWSAMLDVSTQFPVNLRQVCSRGEYVTDKNPSLENSRFAHRMKLLRSLSGATGGICFPELAEQLEWSVPLVTKAVSLLQRDGIVQAGWITRTLSDRTYAFVGPEDFDASRLHAVIALIKDSPEGITREVLHHKLLKTHAPSSIKRIFQRQVAPLIDQEVITVSGTYEFQTGKRLAITQQYAAPITEMFVRLDQIEEGDEKACARYRQAGQKILAQPDVVEQLLARNAATF